jgi:hypothetical protein
MVGYGDGWDGLVPEQTEVLRGAALVGHVENAIAVARVLIVLVVIPINKLKTKK